MKHPFLILMFLILFPILNWAQADMLYTANGQLPSSKINAVAEGTDGRIWVATDNGLCRWDGAKFKHYHHLPGDSLSIFTEEITALHPLTNGRLAVGNTRGLQIYDPWDDSFHKVNMFENDGNYTTPRISDMLDVNDSTLLVATQGTGLFEINLNTGIGTRLNSNANRFTFIPCMHCDSDGRIWIGMSRDGLGYVTNLANGEYRVVNETSIPEKNIQHITEDTRGNLYALSEDGRLYVKKFGQNQFHKVEATNDINVTCLLPNNNGTILLGTADCGILSYSIEDDTIEEENIGMRHLDIHYTHVKSLMRDSDNNLWVNLWLTGLLVSPPETDHFECIGANTSRLRFEYPGAVSAIFCDPLNRTWIAVDHNGIYCLSSDGKDLTLYSRQDYGIPDSIMKIMISSSGTIWLCSFFGLFTFDPRVGKCQVVKAFENIRTFDIAEMPNGELWVATMGHGLFRINPYGEVVYVAPSTDAFHFTPQSDLLNNAWISSINLHDNSKLFINTCYGVGCYDIQKDSYLSTFGSNQLLMGEMVHHSIIDRHGNLWCATTSGLFLWNGDDQPPQCFTVEDGLPSSTVIGILEDRTGRIWVSTNYGLSCLDSSSMAFTNYYMTDGMQDNEFTDRAIALGRDGRIFVGGLQGLTIFWPDELTAAKRTLSLHITDVYLNDAAINHASYSGGKPIISNDSNGRKVYALAAHDNTIEVEMATGLINAGNTRYQYALDNDNWKTLQNGTNRISFSDLNTGTHSIRVRAMNNDTFSPEEEILVIVKPAWYLSGWAILAYAIVIFLMGYFILHHLRVRNAMKMQIQQQMAKDELNEYKLQFLINIAHEIRTPMSLITSPLSQLKEKDTDPNHLRKFNIIQNNVNRILMLINQILDVRKIERKQLHLNLKPVNMSTFISKIGDMFDSTTCDRNFHIHLPDETLCARIDTTQFDKAIVNLISNSLKYTQPGGNIYITLRRSASADGLLELQVSDDGIGLSTDNVNRIFERFYQISNDTNTNHFGSGIGLHLTRSIVELHGGKITGANNIDGPGCHFIVSLPLCDEAPQTKDASDNVKVNLVKLAVPEKSDLEHDNRKLTTRHTVMVVEDDAAIRDYLYEELQRYYNVVSCANGRDAYEHALKQVPDLIVTDAIMPVMDGITMSKKMKQNITLNHIPIIMLTGKNTDEDILKGVSSGVECYLTKPFNIGVLMQYIDNLIEQRMRLKNIYNGEQDKGVEQTREIAMRTPDQKLMDRIMKAINTNLSNADYTIEDLASDAGVSRVHLNRKLRQLTNQTSSAFLRNIRLAKAAELLQNNPTASIADVATLVGFESYPYFSNVFRERYGLSPSEYAKSTTTISH